MDTSVTYLRALALMLIVVFGFTVYDYSDELARAVQQETQSANIFNPVATFLGIGGGTNTQQTNTDAQYQSLQGDDGDAYFQSTGDFLGGGGPTVNTPAPIQSTNTDLGGQAIVETNTIVGDTSGSLDNRKPLLSCIPGVLSPGEEALVTWVCRDAAYKAVGTGFTTGNDVMGITRITASADTTLSLECVNDIEDTDSTTATCDIEVSTPGLAIIATPSRVARGSGTQLSWKTKDTTKCLVTSDAHPSYERSGTEGDVASPALFESKTFTLTCETLTGGVETRDIVVNLR